MNFRQKCAIGALGILFVTPGCSSSNSPVQSQKIDTSSVSQSNTGEDEVTTTTMFGMGPGGETAEGDCPSRMPGEPLTADEAVVKFNVERICPAYVTIELGTPVTWINDGTEIALVKVTGYQAPSPGASLPVVTQHPVGPGETWVWTPEEAGMLGFRIDLVEAFVGTIEVQIPGQGSAHSH